MSFIDSDFFPYFVIGIVIIIIGLIQLKLGVALGYLGAIIRKDTHRIAFSFHIAIYFIVGFAVIVISIVASFY